MKKAFQQQVYINDQNNKNLSNSEENQGNKNKMSFKQFQQNYHGHLLIQKQKKRQQQETLKKVSDTFKSTNDNKSQQSKSKADASKHTLTRLNSKQSFQKLSLSQMNSLNSSNMPSCFVSPKASSSAQMFIKSINIASTKSKQNGPMFPQEKVIRLNLMSNQRQILAKKQTSTKKKSTVIDLNIRGNAKNNNNVSIQVNKDKDLLSKQKLSNKKPSLCKIPTVSKGFSDLISNPSSKALNNKDFSNQNAQQFYKNTDSQEISYINSQLEYVNEVFKKINAQSHQNDQKTYKSDDFKMKRKIIKQIIQDIKKDKNLHCMQQISLNDRLKCTLIKFMENYERDLDCLTKNNQTQTKKALHITIEDEVNEFDLHNDYGKQKSKKKTIKLSKSRRTNEQTIPSDSMIHNFQSSQFSLLNTSKITQISRNSSHKKQKMRNSNEIQNIINSKLITNLMSEQKIQQRGKAQIKYLKRKPSKSQLQVNLRKDSADLGKNKSVTKVISLIGNNKDKHIHQRQTLIQKEQTQDKQSWQNYPPKDVSKGIQHNMGHSEDKYSGADYKMSKDNSLKPNDDNIVKNRWFQSRKQFHFQQNNHDFAHSQNSNQLSHNRSIYELQYLDNYSKQNNFPSKPKQTSYLSSNHPDLDSKYTIPNKLNNQSNKLYSSQLFQ